jgi:integrase
MRREKSERRPGDTRTKVAEATKGKLRIRLKPAVAGPGPYKPEDVPPKRVRPKPRKRVKLTAEALAFAGALPTRSHGRRVARNRIRITKTSVDALPENERGQVRYYDTDLTGFGVCVGKTKKTYFVERAVRGKGRMLNGKHVVHTRRKTIGRHGDITAQQARDKAQTLLAEMRNGIDPVEREQREREVQRAERQGQVALRNLWDEFKASRPLKPSTLSQYGSYVNTAFKDWLDRPVQSISRDDVRFLHTRMSNQKATTGKNKGEAKKCYANSAMRVLRSLLSYAKALGYVKENPVKVIADARQWNRVERRKTYIKPEQLPAWFKALNDVSQQTEPPAAAMGCDYLELVLFTGLRREEAASLTWDQIDFDVKTLTIHDTKNHKEHVLPLTEHLSALLQRRQLAAGKSPFVFQAGGRNKGKGHLSEPRYIADLVVAASNVEFMIHDLRRTFITVAESLDLSYYALKRLVNHKMSGDVTAGYIGDDVERLRKPMQQITEYLLAKKANGQGMKLVQAQ